MRKQFHTLRKFGHRLQSVVAMGYESASSEVAGVPEYGALDDVTAGVYRSGTDTVAVLACAETDATKLRGLAWDHPQLDDARLVLRSLFDRYAAAVLLILLAPVLTEGSNS
jgi:hypothetical protein